MVESANRSPSSKPLKSLEQANTDIAIVGGGMVGASLALLLAKTLPQKRITLIEGFAVPAVGEPVYQPSYDDRSTAIAHGSVGLLQQAGVWSQLLEHACPIKKVHVSDRGHVGGTQIDWQEMQVDALGYVVPNAWVGRVLLSHVQQHTNIRLLAPAKVTQLKPVQGGAELTIESKEAHSRTLHTQLAVIADGAHSPLRAALGIDCHQQDYGQQGLIANVRLDRPHQNIAYERFTDQGPMALLPLLGEGLEADGQADHKSCALVWTHPNASADEVMAMSDEQFLALLQQRFGHRAGRFVSVGKRDMYPLALTVAAEQVRSSVVIMGNAAHFLHPVAGQGFNLALRDCAALAVTLQSATSQTANEQQPLGSLSLLQEYVARQQMDQDLTIILSDQLSKWFSTSALPQSVLRALGFVGMELMSPAKQWFAQQTMGAAGKHAHLPLQETT